MGKLNVEGRTKPLLFILSVDESDEQTLATSVITCGLCIYCAAFKTSGI